MDSLKNILQTLFRLFPFPVRTGLHKTGNPDRNSPVLLTGNFDLTVRRLKKALKGMDAWILVANSRGINVWCAATGGHFTNHDVISVIKTSGIENMVSHRKLILPQLAATGIEKRIIAGKTGWSIVWGPVRASDLAGFIRDKFQKNNGMRAVIFPLQERLEMGISWAFPVSLVMSALVFFWKPGVLLFLNILIWTLTLLIYGFFPVYGRLLRMKSKVASPLQAAAGILFPPVVIWFVLFLLAWGGAHFPFINDALFFFTRGYYIFWAILSFFTVIFLMIDLMGTTPVYKSSLQNDRFWEISIDSEKCRGAGDCIDVCPRNCIEMDEEGKKALISREEDCVQCGACVVQCPFDALFFKEPSGRVIIPETIRKYKLNLMGKRLVQQDMENKK